MKGMISKIYSILALGILAPQAYSAPITSHNWFTNVLPSYSIGNWDMGCNLLAIFSNQYLGGYFWRNQNCWVDVPSGETGVDTYGIDFTIDATVHYDGQSAINDDDDASDSWSYTGSAVFRTVISTTEYYNSPYGYLCYDSVSIDFDFWYTYQSVRTSVFADTVAQTTRHGEPHF